jgi:hypothetical protein
MSATMRFPYARILDQLGQPDAPVAAEASAELSPLLAQLLLKSGEPATWTAMAASLSTLLHARKATLQAAFDTTLAADELRRKSTPSRGSRRRISCSCGRSRLRRARPAVFRGSR